jgi:hypothetical protein
MKGNSIFTLLLLGALGYVAYEMFGQGQSLGTALTFGGMLPKVPGLTGMGCASCYKPTPGLGSIFPTGIYGGYAPTMGMTSIPTRTEKLYNARIE